MTEKRKRAVAAQHIEPTQNLITEPANDNAVPWGEILGDEPIQAVDQVAEIFSSRFRKELSYIDDDGKGYWRHYEGKRWRKVSVENGPQRLALALTQELRSLLKRGLCSERRNIIDDALKKLRTQQALRGIETLSRTHLLRSKDDFDRSKFLFNVANGTIDLRRGEISPHKPEDLQTRLSPAKLEPGAKTPIYDRFRSELFGGSESLANYFDAVMGYFLTGEIHGSSAFHFLLGEGGEGKTVAIGLALHIMGDYAGKYPSTLFQRESDSRHLTVLTTIVGKRAMFGEEWAEGSKFHAARMKDLSSGQPMPAHKMHKDFQTYEIEAKFMQVTNTLPGFEDRSDGYSRRVRVLKANRKNRLDAQDENLLEEMKAESGGILARWVSAAKAYYASGLPECRAVDAATREYIREHKWPSSQEKFDEYSQRFLCIDSGSRVKGVDLYSHYKRWCDSRDYRADADKKVYAMVEAYSQESKTKAGGCVILHGVQLVDLGS